MYSLYKIKLKYEHVKYQHHHKQQQLLTHSQRCINSKLRTFIKVTSIRLSYYEKLQNIFEKITNIIMH